MKPAARRTPHIKMRPMRDVAWWVEFTAPLLSFVVSGPTRTWSEIEAWCRARQHTDVTTVNMIAFLDLTRQIRNIGLDDPLWARYPEDGTRTCVHAKWSCEACRWVCGLSFDRAPKVMA